MFVKKFDICTSFSCFGGKTSGTLRVKSEEIARSPEYPAVQRRGREWKCTPHFRFRSVSLRPALASERQLERSFCSAARSLNYGKQDSVPESIKHATTHHQRRCKWVWVQLPPRKDRRRFALPFLSRQQYWVFGAELERVRVRGY